MLHLGRRGLASEHPRDLEYMTHINVVQAFKFEFPRLSGAASLSNYLNLVPIHDLIFGSKKYIVTRGTKTITTTKKCK